MVCASCGREREDISPVTESYQRRTCGQCAVAFALKEKVRLQERAKRLIVEEAKKRLEEEK